MEKRKVVRGNSRIPAPPVYISECELCGNDETVEAAYEELKKSMGDKAALEYLLVNLWGFDSKKIAEGSDTFYVVEEKQHRTRISGKVVTGNRYSGLERLDDEWILSGNPSEEAKVAARQDISYIQEIRNLSRTSNVTRI